MVVFENITTEMSGQFHCRVATFSQELIRSLKISVFDPGTGPDLHYSVLGEELEVTCDVDHVFPLPSIHLSWHPALTNNQTIPEAGDLMRTTVRRGSVFSVSVTTTIPVSRLPPSITLSCRLALPGTQVVLTETSVFFIEQLHLGPKASMVSDS